ncbi:hypothetical protein HH310_22650 [Actinoplanes sp. TBRC 11911]|uniref:hypothetical protein n=1 Tax=Actinoplanes sp. TBRC 11911 TaxID=2729386 RepID=UPI00145F0AA3|nr:hypothetical protein [Actinoplanes sp. TBRC 11911]NMO53968.1 hypothetical protein [Actinoplanes sp. TBRC 11911]
MQRFPVVRVGSGTGPAQAWSNAATLTVLQASQGLIGPEILGLSVQAEPAEIIVHVCLRATNDEVSTDLADLESAIDALLTGVVDPPVKISLRIHEGEPGPEWPGYGQHRVYLVSDRLR